MTEDTSNQHTIHVLGEESSCHGDTHTLSSNELHTQEVAYLPSGEDDGSDLGTIPPLSYEGESESLEEDRWEESEEPEPSPQRGL